ncbi:AAA family ATPase [Thermus tengchongensis]|uniref:AAA family ATPase n=1 Tax=Thermus tengchongensis TaxID=1214928 RepID=UPI001639FCE3|nr:AAA family ATPase [Thermus tengchongensis]
MDFQHRVAAWVAVRILAEKDATPPWNLPEGTTLEWLLCETDQPVDDLLVGTSANGLVFAQIKRTLQLSRAPDSDLASALDQFVRQFIACQSKTPGTQPRDRALDPLKDRFVIITSPSSSEPIKVHLRQVLNRVRSLLQHQSLDEAAINKKELKALSVLKELVRRSWQESLGTDPSDGEFRQLLSLLHVQVLDLEEGQTDELRAKDLLRTAVLQDPDGADAAWARLISLCANLAAQRSGANRSTLQRELLNARLPLRAPRSYQHDIERLRKYSATIVETLAHLAQIRIGPTTVKIQRACTRALREVAEENSILVVGEPGAGKSGALHDLARALQEEGRDCVFLAVDRLAAQSLGELREEIGLDHELLELLDNWPGIQPAFLVIDALDAARGNPAATMVRDLIRRVVEKGGRWRIVASIRKFDLRYSEEIKDLFVGSPPTEFQDPEFGRVRHLNIPRLSEEEFAQIEPQSAELYALIRSAPAELRDLLRVPFNLRLMAKLVGTGVNPDELTPISTQLELLYQYWSHQVIRSDRDQYGGTREDVLRKACERMVAERVLYVERQAVAGTDTNPLLDDLLSTQILTEWQSSPETQPERYILAFAHHVLFDYAVARLLLQGPPEKVVRRLVDDPDLVVFIRPSIMLHFSYLWNSDRKQFWDLVFCVIRTPKIPEIGKLIGPSAAAELTRTLSDLEPLCATLESSDAQKQGAAEQALRHLVGALLAGVPGAARLLGPGAGPWSELLERVSRNLRPSLAYAVLPLLMNLCDHPEEFTPAQRTAVGQTARRLLAFAWSQVPRDSWLVIPALQAVCRTYESDPVASAALIRRCLEPSHLTQFGFEEMPWLAREVERLIFLDPGLVQEIYQVAFNHQELSEEPTHLGHSRILPLRSNRRQDYQMALYGLAEVFPQFLDRAPQEATHALIAVMEAYVAQRRSPASGKWYEETEETFDFNGQTAHLRTDYSAIWDEGDTYRHHEPLRMLDAFQQYLEKLAEQPEAIDELRKLVQILVSKNRLAVVWRRVLRVGARFPCTFGREILPLAWAVPVLISLDTTAPVGEFIRAIFPTLDTEARQRIEQAILSIPEAVPPDHRKAGNNISHRLLGCLTADKIVTDEARHLVEELRSKNAIPPNEPPVRFEVGLGGPYGEEEYLREQGVPVEAEANRRIRELEQPVKEFADRHLNSVPSLQESTDVLPALRALHEALSRADADGVHPKQRDHAWDHLAAACARIARTDGIADQLGTFVRDILLEASRHPEPTHHPEYDAQFDEHPFWGKPAARIEAAEGLIVLAHHATHAGPDVLEAIQRLSEDPVPAVRFQIAKSLNALYQTAPEFMWRIIERMCREEPSRGVLQGLLTGPLGGLAGAEPDRVAALTKTIFDRVREGPGAKTVREFCVGLFTGLYIWRGQDLSGQVVLEIASHPDAYPDEVHHVLIHLREPVTHGPTSPPDPKADAVRGRALDLLERILHSTRNALKDLEERHAGVPFNEWPQQDVDRAKSLLQLIDAIGREIYFASGAYDGKRQGQSRAARMPKLESERFYREAKEILDELADIGLPSTAHHLLETLEFFVSLDPRGVFLRIGRVVRAGQKGGYQYESLAADRIVRLVERYLAEYRSLLRDNPECRRTLVEILDGFVQAGWPRARQLAYRLEEIFR